MATFNDLATELQIAIWQFVLPYRGIHWIEIEGRPHHAPYVRESIRFVRQSYGELPESSSSKVFNRRKSKEHQARLDATKWTKEGCPSMFFQYVEPVVPSVWGSAGPGDEHSGAEMTEQQLAEELAYTRRCRQLSTYTQVTALLATCRVSRDVALEYIEKSCPWRWFICRSKGPLYRPRPLHVWEAQYANENSNGPDCQHPHTPLVPMIRSPLDLVVLRLHDSHGRPTPLLRQGGFQFKPESSIRNGFPWFRRLAIEWHPRWADEKDQFRSDLVEYITGMMSKKSNGVTMLYWLVDGVPRPNWKRDYPEVVPAAFNAWMRRFNYQVHKYQDDMDNATKASFLADCNLDLEFEANGRRYYVVFVVIRYKSSSVLGEDVVQNIELPLIGGEAIWPEKLRAPARFAYDILNDFHLFSLMAHHQIQFILSWEPI